MPDPSVKDAVWDYLRVRIDRRKFLRCLTTTGLSATVAGQYMQLLAPAPLHAATTDPATGALIDGRGGDVLVEQLRRGGVRYVFANPSSGTGPVFDALVDRSDMHVILGVHEDYLSAMADGYAKASGEVPFVIVSRPGFPNTIGSQYNAFRDRIPMVVCTDTINESQRGRFGQQEVDDLLACAEPFTRWRWEGRTPANLAEDLRRAFKFTGSPPCGPVSIAFPRDFLTGRMQSRVYDQQLFDLSHEIRPGSEDVEAAADALLNSTSPLLYVGQEVHQYGAEGEVVELAELLSVPVAHQNFSWCNAFPTDHPLYIGDYQAGGRYPANVDLMLDLGGGRGPYQRGDQAAIPRDRRHVQVKLDFDNLGRVLPAHQSVPANVRLFSRDLIDNIRARITKSRIEQIHAARWQATEEFSRRLQAAREQSARQHWSDAPLSHERLGAELERLLHPEACIVHEADSARIALRQIRFGPGRKSFFTTSGLHMGWAVGAALGAKLALPDRQVVALIGDGGFMFGGSQALWTAQRYAIPVIVLVVNNRSYDGERTRIFSRNTRQGELGRDMLCYLGDPDIDFTRLAAAYGVTAAKVTAPDDLEAALRKAAEVTASGEPMLLDVLVGRRGAGADSTWYPAYAHFDEVRRRAEA
jgi:benzoylformate decarboxylase